VRCAENPVFLEQVVNDRLLLPVDPAGEEEYDEGERRRQRVHAQACPRGGPGARRGRYDRRVASGWAQFWGHKPPSIASNTPIVARSGIGRVFAQDGIR
jgi:hypothetical protein